MTTIAPAARTYAPIVLAYVLVLVAWELAGSVFHVPKYVLPAPSQIVAALAKNPGMLFGNGWVTLQEVLAGFLIGVVVSIPLGVAIVSWRAVDRIVYPFLVAFQAVPKVALAPILVVWFGFGPGSKVTLGFVTAMFPIVINTVIGLRQTPVEMIHLMRSLGASPLQIFMKVRLVAAAPYIFGGFKLGITLAVVGAVVGEFIASNKGLGNMLLAANNAFDTPMLFGVVVFLSLMSIALFYLVELIEVLVLPGPLRRKGDANTGTGA
ncbi:MAG TPA: ABC transporter permease [Candidatus Elarobacter sp.]|nr:ABC transporter permease [Candidatus Elarobacter sp.]